MPDRLRYYNVHNFGTTLCIFTVLDLAKGEPERAALASAVAADRIRYVLDRSDYGTTDS